MKRVLIVDDSPAACELLKKLIENFDGFEVCGIASDAFNARDQIQSLNPDVITLDVQMPKMDGITFLHSLMRNKPLPTLMISSMTTDGAVKTLEALDVGAIDYIPKPKIETEAQLHEFTRTLHEKLNHVAHISQTFLQSKAAQLRVGKTGNVKKKTPVNIKSDFYHQIIAMTASTGGTDAIRQVLETLSPDAPGVIISQHLPQSYIESFANRLTETTGFQTKVAKNGDIIMPGQIYVCPTDQIVVINGDDTKLVIKTKPMPNDNVNLTDELFKSIAKSVKSKKLCAILTGIGTDGASGCKAIQDAGGHILVQDKDSSVVWDVAEKVVSNGHANEVVALKDISKHINNYFKG